MFVERGHSERADVTEDKHGGSGWGIGIGLVLGIILALLTLLRLPFIDGPDLRTASANKRDSQRDADRLGEPVVTNSEEGSSIDVVEPPAQSSEPVVTSSEPTVEFAPAPPVEVKVDLKIVRHVPDDPQRLPVEAPHPTSLPPLPNASEDYAIGEDPKVLLDHARFLIKAGLAPMAAAPLWKIVRDGPETPLAREAARELDAISRN